MNRELSPLDADDRITRYFKLPSKLKCLTHRKTTCLGKPIPDSQRCGCCGLKYEKEILDPMFYPQDIYYLGSGLVLYFAFIKVVIILTAIGCLVFSGTNLYFNYISTSCASSNFLQCSKTIFIQLSIANKLNNKTAMQIQAYLSVATVSIMFLALQGIRTYMKNIEIEAQSHLNPSHYSILLKMPTTEYSEEDVRQIIQSWWQSQLNRGIKSKSYQFNIYKILISYDLTLFEELVEQKKKIQKSLHREKLSQQEILIKNQRIKEINDIIKNFKFNKTSKVIVILQFCWQMDYIVGRHSNTILRVLFPQCFNFVRFNQKKVQISRAALPGQIHWSNHHQAYKRKLGMRILIGVTCLILIVLGQAGIFGLLYYWFYYKSEIDTTSQQYISYVVSILITVINLILQKVLSVLSKFQYRPTTLEEYVSVTVKKTIAIFLNSGILLLFVYLMLNRTSIWVANGFVDTISLSFLYCIFVPHVLKYIDFDVIMSGFRRLRMNSDPSQIPQAEANKMYERVDSMIHDKYGWMINLVWWAALFAPLVPISFPCVCLSIFIHYWLERFNFVILYRQPKSFGSHMNSEMFKVLTMGPFFIAAGNLGLNIIVLFINQEQPTVSILLFDIIGVGISLLGFVLPSQTLDKIVRCCIKKEDQPDGMYSYKEKQKEFVSTYESQNPLYSYILNNIKQESVESPVHVPSFKVPQLTIKTDSYSNNNSQSFSPMAGNYPIKVFNKATNKKVEIIVPPLQMNWVTYNPTQKKKAEQRIAFVTNMIAEVNDSDYN